MGLSTSIVTWMLGNCQVTIPGDRLIAGYRYLEITTKKPYFVNISAKPKMCLKIIWGVTLGPRYYWFMKQTKAQKSHASVPLMNTWILWYFKLLQYLPILLLQLSICEHLRVSVNKDILFIYLRHLRHLKVNTRIN